MTFQEFKKQWFEYERYPENWNLDPAIKSIVETINARSDMFTTSSCEGHDEEHCKLMEEIYGDIDTPDTGEISIVCENEEVFVTLFFFTKTLTNLKLRIKHYFPFDVGLASLISIFHDSLSAEDTMTDHKYSTHIPIMCQLEQEGMAKDEWLRELAVLEEALPRMPIITEFSLEERVRGYESYS